MKFNLMDSNDDDSNYFLVTETMETLKNVKKNIDQKNGSILIIDIHLPMIIIRMTMIIKPTITLIFILRHHILRWRFVVIVRYSIALFAKYSDLVWRLSRFDPRSIILSIFICIIFETSSTCSWSLWRIILRKSSINSKKSKWWKIILFNFGIFFGQWLISHCRWHL